MSEEISFETLCENPTIEGVFDIHPEEVLRFVGRLKLIDVRQPEEFTGELGHIAESELIPMEHLPEKLPSLDRNLAIVFICRSGARSGRATAFAHSLGFDTVYNMKGGMLFWNDLQLPIVKN